MTITIGGFYIARFEAGVPSDATEFYASSNGDKYETSGKKNTDKYISVSKKNNQSWNYISQVNAKTVSANMYKNSTSVTSQLVDSYAWDTTVKWMKGEDESFVKNSTDKGNYLNNATITDVTNGLFAYHLYGTDLRTGASKTDTAYWRLATKYQKGKYETGRVTIRYRGKGTDDAPEINQWSKISNFEFAESAYDTQNYVSLYIYRISNRSIR